MRKGSEVDIYTKDGEKIAHLLHYLPSATDGSVILVKVGKEFGLTPEERARIADTVYKAANKRVKVLVVDESATIEEGDPRAIRNRRAT